MSGVDRIDVNAAWRSLFAAGERLAVSRSVEAVVEALRATARELMRADGVTVVLREQDICFYAAEDAISPLWGGMRFPAEICVSGAAMTTGRTIVIPDIRLDARVPQEAYARTFVRAMAMVPVGAPDAVAAIGAYWAEAGAPDPLAVERLEGLARLAAIAIERARTEAALERSEAELRDLAATLETRVDERGRQLTEAQEALRHAQKLEAMGQLTGGVAHDFNNLLTPIVAGLDMLRLSGFGGAREHRLIENALQSADRAKTLIHRLLAFARRQPLQRAPVDVDATIEAVRELIVTTVGPGISLRFDIDSDLPCAIADQNQIEIALLNLAVNARDAMPKGGRLTIQARAATAVAGGRLGVTAGDYVRLSVCDTGEGMDEATRARSIEPFFSTKDPGRGTGLGLSMVHGLVTQLGGALEVTSAPGEGAEIAMWLPVSDRRPIVVQPRISGPLVRRSGVALLVDDEELVRASAAVMLADLGFEVLEANSPVGAMEIIESGRRIDILVTDHLMPGMTGQQLSDAARALSPGLPVLIVSGYADSAGISPLAKRLHKPFRAADLADSIGALLD